MSLISQRVGPRPSKLRRDRPASNEIRVRLIRRVMRWRHCGCSVVPSRNPNCASPFPGMADARSVGSRKRKSTVPTRERWRRRSGPPPQWATSHTDLGTLPLNDAADPAHYALARAPLLLPRWKLAHDCLPARFRHHSLSEAVDDLPIIEFQARPHAAVLRDSSITPRQR